MKFTVKGTVLAKALAAPAKVAGTTNYHSPVLSGVRLSLSGDELDIKGTNLDTTISTVVPVEGAQDGVAVVPARLLADIARGASDDLSVEVEGSEVALKAGKRKFTIRCYDVTDFPQVDEFVGDNFTFPVEDFALALARVVPAASGDDHRPALTGVLFEPVDGGLALVATDSYCLARAVIPSITLGEHKVLAPSSSLAEVVRSLPAVGKVQIGLADQEICFTIDGLEIRSRLISTAYPNYGAIIPAASPNVAIVNRTELADALAQIKLIAKDPTVPAVFAFSQGGINISLSAKEVGSVTDNIDAEYTGTDAKVGFSPGRLIGVLDAVGGEEVRIEFGEATKPVLVKPTDQDDDFLYLAQPVRL